MSTSDITATAAGAALKEVGIVLTSATLLSGTLRDCAVPVLDVDDIALDDEDADDRCSTGGVAAVQAYVRYHSRQLLLLQNQQDQEEVPTLVVPMGDFKSALTVMSRFSFGVNVMIYANALKWRTWTVPAYTLGQLRLDPDTVADAQEPLFPALVSNVLTNPAEDWYPYVKSIHFDTETQMAVIYITKEYVEGAVSQVETVRKLVHHIYKYNAAKRCQTPYATSVTTPHSAFQNRSFSDWWLEHSEEVLARQQEHFQQHQQLDNGQGRRERSLASEAEHDARGSSFIEFESLLPDQQYDRDNCFVPVVVFDDESLERLQIFIDAFNTTNITYPPQLIIDIYGLILNDEGNPIIQTLETDNDVTPTWLVSYASSSDSFDQVRVSLSSDRTSIQNITLIHEDLLDLPDQVKTLEYRNDLMNIRQYAHEAWATSLVSEAGVPSSRMAEQTDPDDGYRHCYTRECEMGNLLADGLRWIEGADIGVVPSFMFDGPGWEEGEVRTLEILENLPYATSRCSGTMTGLSLLRLINHSIVTSTFGGFDSTKTGGRLLQVSGMKVVFNNILEGVNRIISVDIWDEDANAFSPLNRTQLYRFVSCGHLCFTFEDYPPFLGEYLTEEGEIPAQQSSESDIKDDLREYLTTNFLSTNSPLRPRIEGRLENDITKFEALPIVTRDDCVDGVSFWSPDLLDCESCPTYGGVIFSKSVVELWGYAFSEKLLQERVVITNKETFPVELVIDEVALPENVKISVASECNPTDSKDTGAVGCILDPNHQLVVDISFNPSERDAGRDTSSVLFTIADRGRSQSCPVFKGRYNVVANLTLSKDGNLLGGVAAFGYTCAAIIILTATGFASWVWIKRRNRLVSTMQPVFLVTLCVGVLLLGAGLVPFSIDDGVASQRGCTLSCIFRPWLLSVGFTLCVAALFSKLWRINKLFRLRQFRRIEIREKDVILPTSILFVLNIVFNLVWTLVEPPHWERVTVEGQPWNTYGRCNIGDGHVATAMLSCVAAVCIIGFIMTCVQAFRARDISSEFSEAKYLGIAVFSWVQIGVVGVPVLFLVDEENVVAKYSLVVGFVFTICMSMLLVVFVPMLLLKHRKRESKTNSLNARNSQRFFSNGSNASPIFLNHEAQNSKKDSNELNLNVSGPVNLPLECDQQMDHADIKKTDDEVDPATNEKSHDEVDPSDVEKSGDAVGSVEGQSPVDPFRKENVQYHSDVALVTAAVSVHRSSLNIDSGESKVCSEEKNVYSA